MSISAALTPSASSARVRCAASGARGEARQRVGEHVVARRPSRSIVRAATISAWVRVKAAGDADHDPLDPGRLQARLQPAAPGCRTPPRSARRGSRDRPGHRGSARRGGAAGTALLGRPRRARTRSGGSCRSRSRSSPIVSPKVESAIRSDSEPVEVEIGVDQLLLVGEADRLAEQVAVLADHRLAVPGQVGRRLRQAGGGVHVGGDRPAGVARAQHPPIAGLADRDVGRRQVGQHRRPRQRAVGASAAAATTGPRRSHRRSTNAGSRRIRTPGPLRRGPPRRAPSSSRSPSWRAARNWRFS